MKVLLIILLFTSAMCYSQEIEYDHLKDTTYIRKHLKGRWHYFNEAQKVRIDFKFDKKGLTGSFSSPDFISTAMLFKIHIDPEKTRIEWIDIGSSWFETITLLNDQRMILLTENGQWIYSR